MPPVQVQHDDFTDVLMHHDGTSTLEFEHKLDPPVDSVNAAEVIAYDIPCRKETVDASNDSIDFSIGPYISECVVTHGGSGYDMFNPPNLHVTHYRSFASDNEENAAVGASGWYPPYAQRSVSGIHVSHRVYGDISPPITDPLWNASLSQKPLIGRKDLLQIASTVKDHSVARLDVCSRSSFIDASDSRIIIDAPFEYPYSIFITLRSANAQNDVAHVFTDMIKIYRAFHKYETAGIDNIDVLSSQIAMEINYAIGWDVTGQLNDGHFPEDTNLRWKPRQWAHVSGSPLNAVGPWPEDPRTDPRYMCIYKDIDGQGPKFLFIDTKGEWFNLTKQETDGSYPQPLQWAERTLHSNGEVTFTGQYQAHFLGSGQVEDAFATNDRQACITTLWGILAFADEDSTTRTVPSTVQTFENFTLPGGSRRTVTGFKSVLNTRNVLQKYYSMYSSRSAARATLGVMKLHAKLRHGVYSIGSIIHQNYKRSGTLDNVPSRHVHVRQAADGLLKEIQDQMNIAYQGYRIQLPLGNTDDIVTSYEGKSHRLHVPHLDNVSPHAIVVSLENADIEDPSANQSQVNLRTNQHRKTRVRICLSDTYSAPRASNNRTLQLLFASGQNSKNSLASMLGFERRDYTDRMFTHFVPIVVGTNDVTAGPSYGSLVQEYMYGIQASSVYDTSVNSKACVIEMGMNAKVNYEGVAVAMVAGRTDHATQTCNTDGSVQSYIHEVCRLSGFNRPNEIQADTSKESVFTENRLMPVVSPFVYPASQNSLNTPVFRASDWGTKRVKLKQRAHVKKICIRGLDARTGDPWSCNSAETSLFMIRLHHPQESKDMYRMQS